MGSLIGLAPCALYAQYGNRAKAQAILALAWQRRSLAMKPMNLQIEYHSGIPVYRQLVSRFQAAIQSHELAAGTKLPPIRALAEQLDINPNTVAKVYRELELRGLIESKVGSGCYMLESAEEQITVREKERFMDELWKKVVSEAASYKIRERDLIAFIKKRAII
jgi:GntR family transcriptional regulator